MRGKRYIAVTVLSWLIILLWGWYFIYDIPRMNRAEALHQLSMAEVGAQLYAENCVVCHGPMGEGVVGPPLNKEAFRGNPNENKEVYDLIYRAIEDGRPGTSTPHWVRLTTGEWASYTAMPTWGAANGGPMNEQMIAAITTFIMIGDWGRVGRHIPGPSGMDENGRWQLEKMPDGVGISAEASLAGKEIFTTRGCVACHKIGSVGGNVGPDLTKLGSWGLDREFLIEWIAEPASVANRAPVYWSNYGGPYQLPFRPIGSEPSVGGVQGAQLSGGAEGAGDAGAGGGAQGALGPEIAIPNTEPLPPTLMPDMGLTDEQIEILVDYLLSLK